MTEEVIHTAVSAATNVVMLAGLPLLGFVVYHRLRHKRPIVETARRAGLALGDPKHMAYGVMAALLVVAALTLWPPPVEPFLREGSPQRGFEGLGLSFASITMALLYGVVATGVPEELLFRGLIAGSLARVLPLWPANVIQATIFLLPHLLLLLIMPEAWPVLILIFAGSLFLGWSRIASGSIIGPSIIHAAANVTMCLSVAIRTAP